jgi:hypothetical protein
VAADSTEGSQVAAANSQYAAQLAARDASDKFTASSCQTLVPLRKHREVQSGTSSSNDAACQASRCDDLPECSAAAMMMRPPCRNRSA